MNELTAFDVAFRGDLSPDLIDVFNKALDESRVMTVSAQSPAPAMAEKADAILAEVISVLDEHHMPIGYIFPGWITRQVRANLGQVESLTQAVDALGREQRQKGREHLHEWLNFDRPSLRTCPGNGNPHLTLFDPCLIAGHN